MRLTLHGDKATIRALNRLSTKVARAAIRKAVRAGGKIMLNAVKARVGGQGNSLR